MSKTAGQFCSHVHEWQTVLKPAANGIVNSQMQGQTMNERSGTRAPSFSEACLCGAWKGALGLEPTPDVYIEHLCQIADLLWTVLRDDGTFWLNIGDSYAQYTERGRHDANDGTQIVDSQKWRHKAERSWSGLPPGTKRKDLLLIPARVALALQQRGWYVRADIAWCKKSHLPEPGNDRPVQAFEHFWLFSKRDRYYYDRDAVREVGEDDQDEHNRKYAKTYGAFDANADNKQVGNVNHKGIHSRPGPGGHNMQNYWLLGPEPFPDAHFAVMPTEAARRAILASTSERGACPECGAPWARLAKRHTVNRSNAALAGTAIQGKGHATDQVRDGHDVRDGPTAVIETLGWRPTCGHGELEPVPQTVLDPFLGSGTTALVADRYGRNAIGLELFAEYATMAQQRVMSEAPLLSSCTVTELSA